MTTNLSVILNSFLQDFNQLGQNKDHRHDGYYQLYTSIKKAFGLSDQEICEMLKETAKGDQ